MKIYFIGEADRIHVKDEYYNGEKILRCSNCGTRGISMFDMHCSGCGFLLNRIDSVDGTTIFSHTPPIKEVDELPVFPTLPYLAESDGNGKTMKQMLILWIVIILALAFICTIAGVPFLFLHYVGFGDWQIVVCGLWLTFWLSLVITAGPKVYDAGIKYLINMARIKR